VHINTLISKSFKVFTELLTAQRTIPVDTSGNVISTNGEWYEHSVKNQ